VSRKIVVLDSAKEEFRELKAYVKRNFGDSVWNTVNAEFKAAIRSIQQNPYTGSDIDELKELGFTNFKFALVRQTVSVKPATSGRANQARP
jgi:toxin ParE1/3/4